MKKRRQQQAKPEPRSEPLKPRATDIAVLHSVTEDGRGLNILRAREGQVEFGAVRPLREGQPVTGEIIRLRPRPNLPMVCDVDVEFAPAKSTPQASHESSDQRGPAQVATEEYRRNWDTIYKRRQRKTELLN